MNHRWAWLAVAWLALAGCATTGSSGDTSERDTPLRAGAVLAIDERLALPPGAFRVVFQGGQVTRYHDRDRFAPWCSLGVRRGAGGEAPAAIEPGRFTIDAVRPGAMAGRLPGSALRVAGRSWPRHVGLNRRGGGIGYVTWYLEMRIQSVAQPQVHDLRCALDRRPDWRGRLGVESVRAALGDLGRILPGGA